jgi:anti-sigma B factor antagonist
VFECPISEGEGVAVVRPRGSLDLESVAVFRGALRNACAGRHVVVNLHDLEYIDSSGVHVLLVYARLCGERGRRFLLADPSRHVHRVLQIVDRDRRLTIAPSLDEAADALGAPREPR